MRGERGHIGHIMKGYSAALALAAAFYGAAFVPAREREPEPQPRKKHRRRGPAPNDAGPVIDTTPESKRARRRRMAKERGA